MKTSIDRKVDAARRRVHRTDRAQALDARSTLELRTAGVSRIRETSIKKPDLKPDAVLAKAAAAIKLLRRG